MSKNDTITPMANKEVQVAFRTTEEYRDRLKHLADRHALGLSTLIIMTLNANFPELIEDKRVPAFLNKPSGDAVKRLNEINDKRLRNDN